MKFVKEPLVHFLVLAGLLFGLEHVFSSTQKEQIIVDRQTVEYLIKQREELELRKLSLEEREQTIAAFVEDEILYSEAYKRGLDKGDSRMRRNMILKMRGLLIGDLTEPTEEELRAFFESNKQDFTRPATIDLQHVFYSDAAQIPVDLLDQLKAGADYSSFGEFRIGMGPVIKSASQRLLVGLFGSEAARKIVAIDDDQWHGPFESMQGTHFVRIVLRTPESKSDYEAVLPYLEGQWALAESRRLIEQELARLKDNYDIVIETGSASGL